MMRSRRSAHSEAADAALSLGPAGGTAVAGALLVVIALAVGTAPLLVAGVGLVALAALCAGWVLAVIAGARLRSGPLPRRVVEGRPVELTVEVRGLGPLGLVGASLRHPLDGVARPVSAVRHGWRRPVLLTASARAVGRGRVAVGAPLLVVSDPIGLARGQRGAGTPAGELIVLPRIEPVHWTARDGRRRADGVRTELLGGAGDLDGLRPYVEGTPATRIHWPALARGAGLQELRFSSDGADEPVLVLDPRRPDTRAGAASLDTLVRAAVSLVHALAAEHAIRLWLPDARTPLRVGPRRSGWEAAHVALALVDGVPPSAAPPRLPRGGSGLLVYLSVGGPEAADAALRWPGEVLLCGPDDATGAADAAGRLPPAWRGRHARFTVAGCTGFALSPAVRAGGPRRRAAAGAAPREREPR